MRPFLLLIAAHTATSYIMLGIIITRVLQRHLRYESSTPTSHELSSTIFQSLCVSVSEASVTPDLTKSPFFQYMKP